MVSAKEKTIFVYFLQKTSGTYSESSLSFLHDLLRREGMTYGNEAIETLATELGSYVRDGSYLKLSSKKIPEHIRAQIDYHLQKSSRASKKTSTKANSAFDELLASLDSEDPRFNMDTTLGLDFTSLEDLEADLKKHALDSLAPTFFGKQNSGISSIGKYSDLNISDLRVSDENTSSEVDTNIINGLENNPAVLQPKHEDYAYAKKIGTAEGKKYEIASESNSSQMDSINESAKSFDAEYGDNLNTSTHYENARHLIPNFPALEFNSSKSDANDSFNSYNLNPNVHANVQFNTHKHQQEQFYRQLHMRAALLDAKEKLLSTKIDAANDPAVLRAVALLDEKLMQYSSLGQTGVDGSSTNNSLNAAGVTSSQSTRTVSEQFKAQINDFIGAYKSLNELKKLVMTPVSDVLDENGHQVLNNYGSSKGEIHNLRLQLNELQNNFSQLTDNISKLVNSGKRSGKVSRKSDNNSASSILRSISQMKVRPLVTSTVSVSPKNSLQVSDAFSSALSEIESPKSDAPIDSEEQVLQKMYALLAVGMREMHNSPTRAKHIYFQLQKLYVTLSVEQKQVIYRSVVEFYTMLSSNIKRGESR